MYQALYRTWRPRTFDEVVGQDHITATLRRQVASGKTSHAYLFTGTRGTGKTSCAKIIARAVNCENPVEGNPCNQCPSCRGIENGSIMDVLELDAASNNGVDQIRSLRDEAIFTPASVKKRVYIVDEVHMLTTAAFNALLKILEEPPAHLMFVLATTELHKVPATIRSRCQQFAFKRLAPQDIGRQLLKIAGTENIALTEEGAMLLARLANGGMRDALSLLDQCAGQEETLDEAVILERLSLAGNADTAELLTCVANGDTGSALAIFARLYEAGREPGSILNELSTLVRDLLIRSAAPVGGEGLLTGGYDGETLKSLLSQLEIGRLLSMLSLLQKAAADLPRSPNPRIEAELCLVKLCGVPMEHVAPTSVVPVARPTAALPVTQLTPAAQPKATAAPVSAEKAADAPPFEPTIDKPVSVPTSSEDKPVHPIPETPIERSQETGEMWSTLVQQILPGLPSSLRSLFADGGKLYGALEGEVLRLYTDGEMTYAMVARPKNLGQIEEVAGRALGRAIRCKVEQGMPAGVTITPPAQPVAPPRSDDDDPLAALGGSGIVFED